MRWTERQRAMLREMGIVPWWRESADAHAEGEEVAVAIAEDGDPALVGGVVDARGSRDRAATPSGRAPAPKAGLAPGTGSPAASSTPSPATASTHAGAAEAPPAATALAPAEWLVVGDAFVAAGADAAEQERLLDNMLAAIGVSRAAPTRQQRAAFVALPDSPPGGARAAAWLDAAIDAVRPGCILALGRAAAQAVLDTDEPLGALRGRRESRAGVPVVVSFAPAFLLRHPVDKAKAWADLCLAVRTLDGTESGGAALDS